MPISWVEPLHMASRAQLSCLMSNKARDNVWDYPELIEEGWRTEDLANKSFDLLIPQIQQARYAINYHGNQFQNPLTEIAMQAIRASNQAFINRIPEIWEHEDNEDVMQAIQRVAANLLEYQTQLLEVMVSN